MVDLDDLLAKARIALDKGDKRGVATLINHILRYDFTHRGTWQLLHQLFGTGESFEAFQIAFAEKHYPNKAHLLVRRTSSQTPSPGSPVVPEKPSLPTRSQTTEEMAKYQPSIQRVESSDATIAMLAEMIFGLCGILGMGWLYAGNVGASIAVFGGYAILGFIESGIVLFTLGCASCVIIPLNLTLVAASSFRVRDYVRNSGARGSIAHVIIGLVIGTIVMCSGIFLVIVIGKALSSS